MSIKLSGVYVSISAFLKLAISLISIPILVRILGIERYGVWIVLNSMMAIGCIFELGLGAAIINRIPANIAKSDSSSAGKNFGTSLGLISILGLAASVVLYGVILLFGRNLFPSYWNTAEFTPAILILLVALLIRYWQQWAVSAEAGMLRYDLQSIAETIGAIILQVGILLLAAVWNSLWVLILWILISTIITLAIHFVILKHQFKLLRIHLKFSSEYVRELFRFGIVQWVSNLGATIFVTADRIIVNLLGGPSAASFYSIVTSVTIKIQDLSAVPLRVISPSISTANALSQQDRVHRIFIIATRLNGVFVCAIASSIIYWADPLAKFLVGQNIGQIVVLLRIAAGIYGIYSLSAAGFFTAIGVGRTIINARWALSGGILMCILLLILTPRFGIVGAICANAGYISSLAINLQVVKFLSLDLKNYFKYLISPMITLILWEGIGNMYFFLPDSFFIKLIVFILCEAASLALLTGRDLINEIVSLPAGLRIRQ